MFHVSSYIVDKFTTVRYAVAHAAGCNEGWQFVHMIEWFCSFDVIESESVDSELGFRISSAFDLLKLNWWLLKKTETVGGVSRKAASPSLVMRPADDSIQVIFNIKEAISRTVTNKHCEAD